ncbi:MAG TPA: rhomboid family intramembrane serine protease [Verrucomicrobiae bacterium]|nr:rhomboid family intramembrane serine protease [Verrucomicrobiae bacterium]
MESQVHTPSDPSAAVRRWPVTNALLLINVGAFIAQVLVQRLFPRFPLEQYFGLSLSGLGEGFLWQLLTFQFLHGGIPHLVLNCWGIYVFGHAIEATSGRKQMLKLYLLSGAVGGGLHVLGSIFFPTHFGAFTAYGLTHYHPVVGASAGLFGLMAAFATLYPEHDLKVLLLFVYPITVSARVLVGVCAGVSLVGLLLTRSNVAHGAHLGGMVAGFLYVRCFLPTERES